MVTITNLTNSPHELTIILPAMGTVSGLTFAPAYGAAIEGMGYFELTEDAASDPLDHDHDGHKGGAATPEPATDSDADVVALMLGGTSEEVAAFIDADAPDDAVLRAYIEAKTGKKAHPNAKTASLVEKAKEAAQGKA